MESVQSHTAFASVSLISAGLGSISERVEEGKARKGPVLRREKFSGSIWAAWKAFIKLASVAAKAHPMTWIQPSASLGL